MRSSSWLAMTVAKFPTQLFWEAKEMKRSLGWLALRADSYGLPDGRPPTTFLSQKMLDRKSTRLNSSHGYISYAVFCLKKKKNTHYYYLYIPHLNASYLIILDSFYLA